MFIDDPELLERMGGGGGLPYFLTNVLNRVSAPVFEDTRTFEKELERNHGKIFRRFKLFQLKTCDGLVDECLSETKQQNSVNNKSEEKAKTVKTRNEKTNNKKPSRQPSAHKQANIKK